MLIHNHCRHYYKLNHHHHSQQCYLPLHPPGHEHDYESIYPSFGGHLVQRSFTNPHATTHFVTGAGGAPGLDKFGDPGPWTRLQIAEWGYGRVTVPNATHFVYEHVLNSNHSVVDRVTIVTDKHGPFPIPPTSQRG